MKNKRMTILASQWESLRESIDKLSAMFEEMVDMNVYQLTEHLSEVEISFNDLFEQLTSIEEDDSQDEEDADNNVDDGSTQLRDCVEKIDNLYTAYDHDVNNLYTRVDEIEKMIEKLKSATGDDVKTKSKKTTKSKKA